MYSGLIVNDIVYNLIKTGPVKESGKTNATTVYGTKM